MWIVRNKLRATIKIEGSPVEIAPGEEADLDLHGRAEMDRLLPLAVAFEEGYLENVFKEAEALAPSSEDLPPSSPVLDLDARLKEFKSALLSEIRLALPSRSSDSEALAGAVKEQLGAVQSELREGVQGLRDGLADVKGRLSAQRQRVTDDHSLSDAEIRARLAMIEETEREVAANFETIGHEVTNDEDGQSDVLDNADLLSNI
jgi:hypothetical protein